MSYDAVFTVPAAQLTIAQGGSVNQLIQMLAASSTRGTLLASPAQMLTIIASIDCGTGGPPETFTGGTPTQPISLDLTAVLAEIGITQGMFLQGTGGSLVGTFSIEKGGDSSSPGALIGGLLYTDTGTGATVLPYTAAGVNMGTTVTLERTDCVAFILNAMAFD